MKQLKTIVLFSFFALATVSCSQNELSEISGDIVDNDVHEVEVTLNLSIDGGLLSSGSKSAGIPINNVTRGAGDETWSIPRELTTIDPAQKVNDMRIYVFRCAESEGPNGTYTYHVPADIKGIGYYDITSKGVFDNEEPYYSVDGKYEKHTVTLKPKLEGNYYYKFLAIGRDDKGAKELGKGDDEYLWGYKVLEEPNFTIDKTSFSDASISGVIQSIDDSQEPLWCTEVFSGILDNDKSVLVNSEIQSFQGNITLKRAVAGLMMYITDIPAWKYDNSGGKNDGKGFQPNAVSIMANVSSTATGLVNREMPENMTADECVTDCTVAFISLDEKNWKVDTDKGIFVWTENGKEEFGRKRGLKENSAMSSNFLMPISTELVQSILEEKDDDDIPPKVTFYLYYNGSDRNKIYACHEKIRIRNSSYIYGIQANYLYALGKKGTDMDNPLPLTPPEEESQENLVIEVIPDWDSYEQLEWK